MIEWRTEDTASVYDEVADTYADHFGSTEPEAPVDLALIEHFVTLLPAAPQVLDAGCGAGRMLPYLAEHGCRVHGVDVSAGMIRRARIDHPEFVTAVASLTDLPDDDAAVDGVFSWYSTIHSSDDALTVMLAEFHRVVRPGGFVLVAFQTGEGVRDVGEGYRARGHDVELMRWSRSLDVMDVNLARAGFMTVARFERSAVMSERDGQGVIIARSGLRSGIAALET